MKKTGKLGLALMLAASVGPLAAQASPGNPAHLALRNSESRELMAPNGRRFQIFLAWPDAPPPAQGYPIVYVLDADRMFGTMVDTVRSHERRRGGMGPAIIVGVGYPRDLDASTERTYDLTARLGSPEPALAGTGGAEDFMAFIAGTVKPVVARRFRIDPARETIFGHSFGGHFVLYTLINRPDLFDTWIASSPAIWLEKKLLTKDNVRKRLGPKLDVMGVAPRILLTVGETGPDSSPDFPQRRPDDVSYQSVVDDVREYAAFLSNLPAMESKLHMVGGDGDDLAVSISQGVRFAIAPDARKTTAATARPRFANPTKLPVPDRDRYMAMTAEQRYGLRLQSRALPEVQRKLWGDAFDHMLNAGLTYAEHRALAEEREAMDIKYGTAPHPD